MNHPKQEEWTPYLFGEATPEARAELVQHLQNCPECSAEIAGWQRSLRTLDHWKPSRPRPRTAWLEPLVKWGIAAAFVLSAGFGLGRWSAPTVDANAMRAEFEASLRSSLAAARSQITDELQTQFTVALDRAVAGVLKVASAESRRRLAEFSQVLDTSRVEDRRQTVALIEKTQQQHAADLLSTRSDLETLAAQTDEGIRRAWQGVFQLASNRSPAESTDKP